MKSPSVDGSIFIRKSGGIKLSLFCTVSQGERLIRSASPTKGDTAKNPASRPSTPHSAPVPSKAVSASPKTIFPYPSHQNASPKSPHRLSFSGIFRSNSTSTSMKIFSRTRRATMVTRFEILTCKLCRDFPCYCCTEQGLVVFTV
ncbi:hypothetical protein GOODEAATRI_019749 [Goodea atripinnis]|uniref:Uncharacterized protein n=1 Tax=Goodea atripinnis TaxID=208336 RepID=A0ABV0NLY4_9TELE